MSEIEKGRRRPVPRNENQREKSTKFLPTQILRGKKTEGRIGRRGRRREHLEKEGKPKVSRLVGKMNKSGTKEKWGRSWGGRGDRRGGKRKTGDT